MYETRPALVVGARRPVVRVTLFLLGVFCLAWFAAALFLLVEELRTGRHGVSEYWGMHFPSWIAFVVVLPISVGLARDTFQKFKEAGPNHGIVDYVDQPIGLLIVHPRTWHRRQTLLVERGDRLEIAATLVYSRRRGRERQYRYVVSSPRGSFTFTRDGWIEKFSLAPLDAAVRPLDVTVVTSGAANALMRGAGVAS